MNEPGGRLVLLGQIVGLHGLRGEVKVESFTEPRLAIFDYRPWLLDRAPQDFEVVDAVRGRTQGKGLAAALPGIEDRDAAARLVGTKIFVSRDTLPNLPQGEFYQSDLEGLEVVNTREEALGKVSHLFDTGANQVLVAIDEDGRERLIPWVPDAYVVSVDVDAGRITVDWDRDF